MAEPMKQISSPLQWRVAIAAGRLTNAQRHGKKADKKAKDGEASGASSSAQPAAS